MSFLGESDKGNQVSNTFTWTYVPDQDVSVDAYYANQADDPAPLIIPVALDNPDASDVTTQAIFDTASIYDSSVSETLLIEKTLNYVIENGYERGFNALPADFENAQVVSDSSNAWGAFLGRYGNEGADGDASPTTSVEIPLGGKAQTIEFDFLRIDSWDNETFNIWAGEDKIFSEQFQFNKTNDIKTGNKVINGSTYSYTIEPYGSLANTVFSGWNDQKYRISLTTPAGMETLDLGFSSTLNQSITDESWGIDNLSYTKPPVGGGDSIYSRRFNSLPTDIDNAKVEAESSSEWGAFLGRFSNEKTSIQIPLNIGAHLTRAKQQATTRRP